MVSDFLFGHVRWSFVSELYELMQSVYTFPAMLKVLVNPRAPTFNVTAKGETLTQDFISPLAKPFYLFLFSIWSPSASASGGWSGATSATASRRPSRCAGRDSMSSSCWPPWARCWSAGSAAPRPACQRTSRLASGGGQVVRRDDHRSFHQRREHSDRRCLREYLPHRHQGRLCRPGARVPSRESRSISSCATPAARAPSPASACSSSTRTWRNSSARCSSSMAAATAGSASRRIARSGSA